MTPAEFFTLSDRHAEAVELKYCLPVAQFAQFACLWANSHGAKMKPADFIPDLRKESPPVDPGQVSAQLVALFSGHDAPWSPK